MIDIVFVPIFSWNIIRIKKFKVDELSTLRILNFEFGQILKYGDNFILKNHEILDNIWVCFPDIGCQSPHVPYTPYTSKIWRHRTHARGSNFLAKNLSWTWIYYRTKRALITPAISTSQKQAREASVAPGSPVIYWMHRHAGTPVHPLQGHTPKPD